MSYPQIIDNGLHLLDLQKCILQICKLQKCILQICKSESNNN